jgi:mono/diheme cytochrome c family protein
MKQSIVGVAAVVVALTIASGTSYAQGKFDFGQREFSSSCASCHGVTGKGDGPMQGFLVKAPPNLTMLSKNNGGVFPYQFLWETIDGRAASVMPGSHGAREMPVWGDVYRSDDQHPQDWFARNRIASLIDYLSRIQEK